jgi:hypothetical protein
MPINLKTLLRNFFSRRYFKDAKSPVKRRTRGKRSIRPLGLFEEVGKEFFKVKVKVNWGRCPYCETVSQMVSVRPGYYTCTFCRELTKQYVNGSIQYLPINDKHALDEKKDGA